MQMCVNTMIHIKKVIELSRVTINIWMCVCGSSIVSIITLQCPALYWLIKLFEIHFCDILLTI